MPETNLPNNSSRRIHPSVPFTVLLLILLYLSLNAWIYFYGTRIFNFNLGIKNAATNISVVKEQGFGQVISPAPKPTPPPRKIYPLPSGTQSWKFSHGPDVKGPKIQTATVDPLTPNTRDTQTVTVTIKNDTPVTAAVTLYTDTMHKTFPMKLTTGTLTDGTWTANWKMEDTYNNTYHIDFTLDSASGNWTGALTFR